MAIKISDSWQVSHDLRALSEILHKRNQRAQMLVDGSYVTDELPESSKGVLETIKEDFIRRKAAPLLERLDHSGVEVEVDFDYRPYLPVAEVEIDV